MMHAAYGAYKKSSIVVACQEERDSQSIVAYPRE